MVPFLGIKTEQIQADLSQKLLNVINTSNDKEKLKIIQGLVERLDAGYARDLLSILEMLEKEKHEEERGN